MTWDISPDDIPPGGHPDGEYYEPPSTFIATVIEVLDIYDPRHENGIKYLVKIEDTDEEIGLYGGEMEFDYYNTGEEISYEGRDKWIKLPKLDITEETDIFGQGLLDPVEPEEFEGEDEEWEKMVSDVEDDEKRGEAGEPGYQDITHLWSGEKTDPASGYVAPSSDVTDNICKVKGFCKAQGPITFGQLKALVEAATSKRIQADMGRGAFKMLWRIIPFFVPQILIAAVGVTATRAFNKIITPALKDTRGYKNWWGKVVLKAMDVAEGDYIPDITMGDDPLSKVFFISDGLMSMIKDKYKLKFARYVADYAAARPDDEPVPEWFVENLLRDYLNQKFLLDPPLLPKEGTNFDVVKEHDETEVEVSDNESYQKEFTKSEVRVLNYLSKQFTYDELKQISSTDETELPSELQTKWADIIKLFGERTDYVERVDYWVKSTRWAKWAVDNWSEAVINDAADVVDFSRVTNPIMDTPKMYRVAADESMWEKVFRSGETYVGAFDEDDAYDRADSAWYNYDVDMETYDYGDTDSEELNIEDPEYLHDIMEHENSRINPELEEGDKILVVSRKETPAGYRDPFPEHEPELFTTYVVIEKKYSGHKAKHPYHYFLLPEDKYDIFINDPYDKEVDNHERSLFPWIHDWILDNEDIIAEHKESKINPELEVGDIVRVIEVDGEHERMPDRYGIYKVVHVGSSYDEYYDIVPHPSPTTWHGHVKTLHRGDTWIYGDIPMANKVDRKTISEHKESKVNPQLMIGDEITVLDVNTKPHATEWRKVPEPYKDYVVTGIKQSSRLAYYEPDNYYELTPVGETEDQRLGRMLAGGGKIRREYLYPTDVWMLKKGFRRGEDLIDETITGAASHYFQGQNNVDLKTPELEQDLKVFHGLEIDEEEELEEFCPMGNPNKCTPVDYDKLPDMLHEHEEGKNMKGFTPKLIGYLKFMFGTQDIKNVEIFQKESRRFMGTNDAFSSTVYLILLHNKNKHNFSSIGELLNNLPIEDYEIPTVYEYEVVYYGSEQTIYEPEECDSDGYGNESGEDCDCIYAEEPVEDEDGNVEYKECHDPGYDGCECEEYANKEYELYMNETCRRVILSLEKLENTEGSYTYGYETMDEIDGDLGYEDSDYVVEYEDCDDNYDEAETYDYFHDKDGEIIGLETDVWESTTWDNYFTDLNKQIYGVKSIEEQYDMVSQRDKKMMELTSQIFNILDENFAILEHEEGELEYDGKKMGLYSYENDSFVPFEHIYNPILPMVEGGIQQEDIEIFVEIMTNWVNKNMTTRVDRLNEEVNIKSEDSNYNQEDYDNFVDFAHKELKIKDDCPIDVESEPSSEYTTGNYHIYDKKIKVLDNGRKLADILRTIAHELVHHKQNELGMLVGDIPEIGGKIEDQANAYAGRLVKKYGKQTPNLYMESKKDMLSEEKVVGFNNPSNNFVVIAGGPGAGKSFITRNLINLDNVKEFNVDQVRVMTAKKLWGDEWEENISTEEGYDEILRRTFTTSDPRNLTVKHLKQFLEQERNQPVNVVYDAGGGQEQVMKDVHNMAKENGFNTTLVYVRTPLDVAQERNIERPRSLPPEMVAQYHQQVKNNMRNMIPIFDNVWTVDNKDMIDLSNRPSDNIEKIK